MKIDRLLEIVILLLNRGYVTTREMAERFQVSQRTIQRDMVSLALAGIPLYTPVRKASAACSRWRSITNGMRGMYSALTLMSNDISPARPPV